MDATPDGILKKGTTLRDVARDMTEQRKLDERFAEALRLTDLRETALRVRAVVFNDEGWLQIRLQCRISEKRAWVTMNELAVARQYGGVVSREEAIVVAALRRSLGSMGATVLALDDIDVRVGNGQAEYRYWARLGSRLSVALQTRSDGTVAVVGLA
jgi:hypothetical protein